MANEITVTASLRYAKSKAAASLATNFLADQTGDKYEAGVQVVGTAEEELQKGDIGTIGYVAVRNMDTTNFVQLGAATGEYTVKLLAGKGCVFYLGGTTLYVKADTASVEIEYLAIEA